ncbi:MAG TPA: hypothetical protein DGT21_12485 [Armatimonadetes bacterium]|nr:hypothetical protein [Armatimonadota bacterium]
MGTAVDLCGRGLRLCTVFVCTLCSVAVCLPSADYGQLVAGTGAVGSGAGTPGPLWALNATPVPIVSGDDDTTPFACPVVMACEHGAGRFVAMSDNPFFTDDTLPLHDNSRFGDNVIDWLDVSNRRTVMATTGHSEWWAWASFASFTAQLEGRGYVVTRYSGAITEAALSGVGVVIMENPSGAVSASEITAIEAFVRNGGGLLLTGLGWAWDHYRGPLDEYPVNHIGEHFGVRWVSGYVGDSTHCEGYTPYYHTFYPDCAVATFESACSFLTTATAAYGAGLPAALQTNAGLRADYFQAHMLLAFATWHISPTSSQRSSLYAFLRQQAVQQAALFQKNRAYNATSESAMAWVRERFHRTLIDAQPLTSARKADISQVIGLFGDYAAIWDQFTTILGDNTTLDAQQRDFILRYQQSLPAGICEVRHISVVDFLGNGPAHMHLRGNGGAVNIFGLRIGVGCENSFPSDVPPTYCDVFCLVVAHELNHVVDALYIQNRQELTARRAELLAAAGDEPRNYLRSMFDSGFFATAPQEFFASISNQWFHDSAHTVRLGLARFDAGYRDPINQAIFFADVYSMGTTTTWFYTMDTAGNLARRPVYLRRDGNGHIITMVDSDTTYSFEVAANGDVTDYTVTTTGHSVLISEGPAGSPNPVASRGDVACSVSAVDSLGHDLLYMWSAVDADGTPVGSFDDPTVRTPVWTAPENATGADLAYTISVTVACSDDPDVHASAQFTQAVSSGAVAEHIVAIMSGPSGSPNPCAPGGQVQCTVSAYDSIDGHTLAYSWSATGPDGVPANHFDDATVRNPVWTAPAQQAGAGFDTDDYQIAVTVFCADDGGVRAFGSFTQRVQQLTHEVIITGGPSGDPNPCRPGDEVRCTVGAEDVPQGHDLLYGWEATGGSFDDPTSPEPTWTAPATETTVEYTLTVVVTCAENPAVSATASYQQLVAPVVEHAVTITEGPAGDPASVASGGNVACSVTAEDSHGGHVVRYSWTTTGPGGGAAGSFSNATAQNPTWTAPENRTDAAIGYEITVVAACGAYPLVNDTASFTVAVEPVAHTVTITDGPAVAKDTLLPGGATRCTATAEDSRQGHTLAYAWSATDGAGNEVGGFYDASAAQPTWTAPANATGAQQEYTIGVTVSCSGNAAVRDTGTVSVIVLPVFQHQFAAGTRMIGIPAAPVGAQGLVDVLAAPDIVRWNPATEGYESLGSGDAYAPGCGYWGRFGAQTEVAIPGTSVLGTLDYPVATGWNIVSSPYDCDLNLDAITGAPTLLPFAWTDQGDGYRLVANLQDCLNQVDNTIHPWWGYWVYAGRAGTLSWNPSHVAADGIAELLQIGPVDRERGGWQVQLVAEAAGRVDACNYFGVATQATVDALSIPNPPSLPASVDIYLPSESGPMASDIRTPAAGALSWEFVVTCGLDAPVTLSFPDLTAVPAGYRLTLRDLATDKTVNMRTTRTYSYQEQGERRFRIEATRGNGNTLVVSGVTAQQIGEGGMSISYTLSASAEVSIEVRNISGRLIRSVSCGPAQAGLNTAAWDLRNAGGARIPSGVYLCTIGARSADGTQISAIRTLNVAR